mmetsp:Transcript_43455/g.52679  ORF Transcript_43455/g.52679 Transcript_43455/m.52679 type:complete len:129 (-) Transcript_43455:319-705(-)
MMRFSTSALMIILTAVSVSSSPVESPLLRGSRALNAQTEKLQNGINQLQTELDALRVGTDVSSLSEDEEEEFPKTPPDNKELPTVKLVESSSEDSIEWPEEVELTSSEDRKFPKTPADNSELPVRPVK